MDPDVAKPLAIVALCYPRLGHVYFHIYNVVIEAGKGENLL
jgi:hypothetical protein